MAERAVKPGKFLIWRNWYVRDTVARIPAYFVFGDNVEQKGSGPKSGQAIIRGLPNAIGIATKWSPKRTEDAYFDDFDPRCAQHVHNGFKRVIDLLNAGYNVYYPAGGIGTGRAELQTRAPSLHLAIDVFVKHLQEKYS